jgi:hypothetical protein
MRFSTLAILLAFGVMAGLVSDQLTAGSSPNRGSNTKPKPTPPPPPPPAAKPPSPPPPQPQPQQQPKPQPQPQPQPKPNPNPNPNVNNRPNPQPNPNNQPVNRQITINTDYVVTFNTVVGKVRLTTPPLQYDDKGQPKKLTSEDLAKLKGDETGDDKLPGYACEITEITTGDTVTITLKMPDPNVKKPAKDAATKDDKPATADDKTPSKDEKPGSKDIGDWVSAGQLVGKVQKIDNNSAGVTLTVRVARQQNTTDKNAKDQTNNQTYDPKQKQGSMIQIAARPGDKAPVLAAPDKEKKADKDNANN